jgi:hypothetical protein
MGGVIGGGKWARWRQWRPQPRRAAQRPPVFGREQREEKTGHSSSLVAGARSPCSACPFWPPAASAGSGDASPPLRIIISRVACHGPAGRSARLLGPRQRGLERNSLWNTRDELVLAAGHTAHMLRSNRCARPAARRKRGAPSCATRRTTRAHNNSAAITLRPTMSSAPGAASNQTKDTTVAVAMGRCRGVARCATLVMRARPSGPSDKTGRELAPDARWPPPYEIDDCCGRGRGRG